MSDELVRALSPHVAGTVRRGRKGKDDHDASHYRLVPGAVLEVWEGDDLAAAVEICARVKTPITMRGGGTSLAGQAVGSGLIVDTRALASIEIDPERRSARVGPGATLDAVNEAAAPHGLWFGPDVSSSAWATIGGMIGNDSCGARSPKYGRTCHHLEELDLVFADATRSRWRAGAPPAIVRKVAEALEPYRAEIEDSFPPLPRRVAGYGLDRWVAHPEAPGVLAGSEGTLVLVAGATLKLSPRPSQHAGLVFFGDHLGRALETVVALEPTAPDSAELLDGHVIDRARVLRTASRIPLGTLAMLIIEYLGEDADARATRARRLVPEMLRPDPAEFAAFAQLRKKGLGLLMGRGGGLHPMSIIEDLAVPPSDLPAFTEAIAGLLRDRGLQAAIYGHASAGCLHIRPWFDLDRPDLIEAAVEIQRAAVALACSFGGSSSGEHGDGRVRSHLLPLVYPPRVLEAFLVVKDALDPGRLFNPGIIVDAALPSVGFDRSGAGAARIREVVSS